MHICPVEIMALLAAVPAIRATVYALMKIRAKTLGHTLCSGSHGVTVPAGSCKTILPEKLSLIARGDLNVTEEEIR